MQKRTILLAFCLLCLGWACQNESANPALTAQSPDGKNKLSFELNANGVPTYRFQHGEQTVIDTSTLGFEFKDMDPMLGGWTILHSESDNHNETWEMPWGEQRTVTNHYNRLKVYLQEIEAPQRKLHIEFKVYDDGLGFRYEFPEQEGLSEVTILDEKTEFQLTGDHQVWWIPGDWDIYEHLYKTTSLSGINATQYRDHPNLGQTYIPVNAVNTPVTMKTKEGLYLSFHEAALLDYAGMTLQVDTSSFQLMSNLVGSDRLGYKVKRTLPFTTPWRTILVAEKATDLIESRLILNLNEPNKLGDVSWFKPTKYTGIWWDMHMDTRTWKYEGGRHGATTEYAKEIIDFSAENGIGAMLVEGWNTGWERWIGFPDREGVFDFVTPYPDYDLREVVRYGKEKGVELIMHHETSAAVRTYDQQLDTAYALMKELGIHAVKTGYVGKIIPTGEYHHGQWMVNHYHKVELTGAEHQVAINAHEPIKATGLRRTWPNIISREGLRGQEFNAWAADGGNPPEHLSIVAFTRMLAGPIDYTPGIFNIKIDPYKPNNQVNTTLAHQLALYVVIYSPIQMVPDLIEHYEGQPAFQFIREVGVDWEQSKVLNGEPGDFVTIAREERGSGNWFLGAITDEEARTVKVKLDFLPEGQSFVANIYRDGPGAHWNDNPNSISIEKITVDQSTELELKLAPGGGVAISFFKQKK